MQRIELGRVSFRKLSRGVCVWGGGGGGGVRVCLNVCV